MIAASQVCTAPEPFAARVLRNAAKSALIVIGVVECCMATLMYAGHRSLPNTVFLLSSLGLLVSILISLHDASGRVLIIVQSAAAASLLALFWAGGTSTHAGPSLTIGGSTYDLTLTLAALLFAAIPLARLLRRRPEATACNCG